MSNSCKKGKVYFNKNDAFHLAKFSNEDGSPCSYTNRLRWSFMIINKKEVQELCPNENDKHKILEDIVNKYSSYLSAAVKKEALIDNKELLDSNLKGSNEIVIKDKLIRLQSAKIYGVKSYGSLLKSKKYTYAYNNALSSEEKVQSKAKTASALDYTRQSAQEVLNKEAKEKYKNTKQQSTTLRTNNTNNASLAQEENSSYIIISMPYVYNYMDNSDTKLEVILYEKRVQASYMPEVIVEYGVFYDGTNNNMYNIDFYENYKKFLEEPCKYIINSKKVRVPTKNSYEAYETIQEYIAAEENPNKNQIIMTMLQEQILASNIRYFDKKSKEAQETKEYDSKYWGQAKLSSHAEKVFDYFLKLKEDEEDTLGSNEEQNKFLYKKILPNDKGDGSYTNGKTNINRLYNLYNGDDVKTKKDVPASTRFKVYASGSGTYDVFEKEDYKSDSTFGLGLGLGETGVKAHIIYTCFKMATQLREASIFNINELILDTFGFSRGAASARHFVCSIIDKYELTKEDKKRKYTLDTRDKKDIFSVFFEQEDGLYTVLGNKEYFNPLRVDVKDITVKKGNTRTKVKNPFYNKEYINIENISFRFVGIYDTVTHYGAIQSNDYKDLNIDFAKGANSKKLGHIAHIMADDEYRYNFDAYSIFELSYKDVYNSNEEGNFEEFIIPGAHADVGGGYNEKDELVYLGGYNSSLQKLKNRAVSWNRKFFWLLNNDIKIIEDKVYLKQDDLQDENDGFFITKESLEDNTFVYHLYMYKKHISNKYAHVSLKLMYDKAINDKDNLEKVPLSNPVKLYDFSDKVLSDVYENLMNSKKISDLDEELYTRLKDDYIHHSSSINNFVNKPSNKDKDIIDFYGKRVVYGSRGEVF